MREAHSKVLWIPPPPPLLSPSPRPQFQDILEFLYGFFRDSFTVLHQLFELETFWWFFQGLFDMIWDAGSILGGSLVDSWWIFSWLLVDSWWTLGEFLMDSWWILGGILKDSLISPAIPKIHVVGFSGREQLSNDFLYFLNNSWGILSRFFQGFLRNGN